MGMLWDVGGNPGKIEDAAAAYRWLADDLRLQAKILVDEVAKGTLETWREGKSRDAFQGATDTLKAVHTHYASALDGMADQLHDVAEHIKDAQRQASNFQKAAIGAVAIGGALMLLTGPLSEAAGAAEAAAAAAGFWAMMARLAAVLLRAAAAFNMKAVTIAVAVSAVSKVGFKALDGNPFKADAWTADDASDIIFGGLLGGGIKGIADAIKGTSLLNGATGAKSAALKLAGNGLAGIIGGGTGSALDNIWLRNMSLKKALTPIAQTAGLGLVAGSATRGMFGFRATRPFTGKFTAPLAPPTADVLQLPDYLRITTGIPVGAGAYAINLGKTDPRQVTGTPMFGLSGLSKNPPVPLLKTHP